MKPCSRRLGLVRRHPRAFTLLEILIATSLFIIILGISIGIFGQVSGVWRRSVEKVRAFQSARVGFDLVTRSLGQATLNTYLDYVDSSDRFPADSGYDNKPVRYARRSDLQFICAPAGQGGVPGTPDTGTAAFFQMPNGFEGTTAYYTGLGQLLNTCGYFVQFSDDTTVPPHAPERERYRYRLMQMMVPTQENEIYTADAADNQDWYKAHATKAYPIAENIICMILVPLDPVDPISPNFSYDSRLDEREDPQPITANQMPPAVQLIMVAIDETSALRLENGEAEPAVIRSALQGKFDTVANLETHLDQLEFALREARINYQVFSSSVPIRESKWSKQ